ncbi:MAG: DMT family transporter [Planctomycetaceae bacterium]|nr:DMT family transporter [Planctomycetaceae bacterium]
MKDWPLLILAAVASFVIPFQAIINGRLGQSLDHRLYAAFFSFVGGTTTLIILVLCTTPGIPRWPAQTSIPWYYFTGGLLGVVFVTTVLTVTPKIGAGNVVAATVVGQLIMAMIIDHFGIMGVEPFRIGWSRLAGAALLIAGVILIHNK